MFVVSIVLIAVPILICAHVRSFIHFSITLRKNKVLFNAHLEVTLKTTPYHITHQLVALALDKQYH